MNRSAKWAMGTGIIFLGTLALWRVEPVAETHPTGLTKVVVQASSQIEPAQNIPFAQPDSSLSSQPANPLVSRLAEKLAVIYDELDAAKREQGLVEWVSNLPPADFGVALEFLQGQTPTQLTRDLAVSLIRRWAESDPVAAGAYAQKMSGEQVRPEALSGVAIVWANQDLLHATEWVEQWSNIDERQNGLTTVAYEAARNQPIAALTIAVSLPVGPARDNLIARAATQWASTEPEAAAQWALQIPDPRLSQRILANIATEWGNSDPVAAVTFTLQSLPPGKQQDDAIMGIVLRLVQQDPERTADWVSQFPDGDLKRTAMAEVTKLLAKN